MERETYAVYPRRRTWVGLILFPVFMFLALAVVIADASSGLSWRDALYAAIFLLCAYGFVVSVRQIRSPLPVVTLDGEAIEGAFGRQPWLEIERVSFRSQWPGSAGFARRVVLHLAPDSRGPRRSAREYASGFLFGRSDVGSHTVEIPFWASRRRVAEDLRRFFRGPIED